MNTRTKEFTFFNDKNRNVWIASLIYNADDKMIFNGVTKEVMFNGMTPNFSEKCIKIFNEIIKRK